MISIPRICKLGDSRRDQSCPCPNEATAVKVAQVLRKVGFKRIRPLHGGIDAWIQAGNAVEY